MFEYDRGIRVPAADLWIDPSTPKPFAFVSHAHGDHIGRHDRILATAATARFMRHRLRGDLDITIMEWNEPLTLDGDVQVTAIPAGHIKGSAQLLVEHQGERLVYSGDIKLRGNETAEPCEIVPCDTLILETTYGRPHYKFPPRDEVLPQLVAAIEETLAERRAPVLLAYTLGRSQELLKLLEPQGFKTYLAYPIEAMVRVFEGLGVRFGPYERAYPGRSDDGVLFVPPHASKSRWVRGARNPVRIAATGWAMDDKGPPYPADRWFPISDHADFDELMEYVERSKPRTVYTTHGFAEFTDHLRERGVSAFPLTSRTPLH